jgi:hypothetical protein
MWRTGGYGGGIHVDASAGFEEVNVSLQDVSATGNAAGVGRASALNSHQSGSFLSLHALHDVWAVLYGQCFGGDGGGVYINVAGSTSSVSLSHLEASQNQCGGGLVETLCHC